MTPNPDSPSFIRNEIPVNASNDAVAFRDIFTLLMANAASSVWHFVSEDNLTFEYNTHTGAAKIKVCLTDTNEHNHTITLQTISHEGCAEGEAIGEYLFEGTVNTDKPTFRSYAEWLMMELWNTGYDASLCKCDRGLEIPIVTECVYDLLSKMLDIVTNNIKPIEWFVSDEPIWKYYTTYHDLCLILPKLKEEAATERWKDVKPENFILSRGKDHTEICLDYIDGRNYEMHFRMGLKDGGFAAERPDKFIDMYYEFVNLSNNEEIREYYKKQNLEFCNFANALLDIPFHWKALLFHGEDDFYINCYRSVAFQKFCLMLDCMIPLIHNYSTTEQLITSDMIKTKQEMENLLNTKLDIVEDKEPYNPFGNGFFIEECVEDDIISCECPF